MYTERHDSGLGGWLILVGIGIVLAPIRILVQIIPTYSDIFASGAWGILTTPGTEAYHPLWFPIIIGEIMINGGMVLAWIYLAVLFFSKRKLFPKLYIGILVFNLLFLFFDTLTIKIILPDEPMFDSATVTPILQLIVTISIWVPYMLVSKRVKATFIK